MILPDKVYCPELCIEFFFGGSVPISKIGKAASIYNIVLNFSSAEIKDIRICDAEQRQLQIAWVNELRTAMRKSLGHDWYNLLVDNVHKLTIGVNQFNKKYSDVLHA